MRYDVPTVLSESGTIVKKTFGVEAYPHSVKISARDQIDDHMRFGIIELILVAMIGVFAYQFLLYVWCNRTVLSKGS